MGLVMPRGRTSAFALFALAGFLALLVIALAMFTSDAPAMVKLATLQAPLDSFGLVQMVGVAYASAIGALVATVRMFVK